MKKSLATLVLIMLVSVCSAANEIVQNTLDSAKYVAINIEIKELKESGAILKEATQKLAETLEQSSNNIDELSPEQLRLINTLADKVDSIALKLNETVGDLPNAIKRAQDPSAELLRQALQQVKQEAIAPITDTLELWLIITVIGLCILGIGLCLAFIYCAKHIGNMGATIKEIADGYRIIPVEQYEIERSGDGK